MTVTAKPAKKQDRTTMALFLVAAFVAVGGIGFAVGHLTGGSSTAAANGNGAGGGPGGFARASLAPGQTFDVGQFGGGAGRGGLGGVAGGVTGTVASVNGTTMTITLANGSTVTVDLSGSTTYHNETAGSSSDVKAGSTVTVQIDTRALASGSPNPSASGGLGGQTLTAKDVLITTP
jgi:preprotein translocase subunit YajC